jgi:hypothetical protein
MSVQNFVSKELGAVSTAFVISIDRRAAHEEGEAMERYYTVQFNPSELTIDASAQITPAIGSGTPASSGTDAVTPLRVGNPNIFLTVKLIFDEVTPSDAFMADAGMASAAGIAKGIAGQVRTKMLGGSGPSVQPVVEGFIGAIRNGNTRLLRFRWGGFCFTGVLRHINAEYVMFSPQGNPIRAYVTLRLINDLNSDRDRWREEINVMQYELGPSALEKVKSGADALLNIGW